MRAFAFHILLTFVHIYPIFVSQMFHRHICVSPMEGNISIRFYPNSTKTVGEKVKIYCRVTIDRKKSEFYTGFLISPKAWDDKKRKTNNMDINAELVEIETKLHRKRRELLDRDIPLTASNVVEHFKGGKSSKTYLLEYFYAHIIFIEAKGEHSKVTYSQYRSTFKILTAFIKDALKKNDLVAYRSEFQCDRSIG